MEIIKITAVIASYIMMMILCLQLFINRIKPEFTQITINDIAVSLISIFIILENKMETIIKNKNK